MYRPATRIATLLFALAASAWWWLICIRLTFRHDSPNFQLQPAQVPLAITLSLLAILGWALLWFQGAGPRSRVHGLVTVALTLASGIWWVIIAVLPSWRGWGYILNLGVPGERTLAVTLSGAAALGWVLMAFEQRRADSETRCRKCGFILRGLSEPRCPECGERI